MSRFVLFGLLLTTGCGGLAPRAGGLPPVSSATHAPRGVRPAAAPTLDADPDLARDRRALVLKTATALEARAVDEDTPRGDTALLLEVFGGLSLEAAPRDRGTAEAWLDAARPRNGRPRPGDLAVFREAPGVPRVAIVVEVHPDGLVECLGETRAAWRRIKLHPEQRAVRRHKGRVLNTFLRVRRPDDPPRARYLAGQLLQDFRTLLD